MTPTSLVARELRPIVDEAIGRGCWELVTTRRRAAHSLRLVHRSGRFVPLTKTRVSDRRVLQNLKAELRRIERGSA